MFDKADLDTYWSEKYHRSRNQKPSRAGVPKTKFHYFGTPSQSKARILSFKVQGDVGPREGLHKSENWPAEITVRRFLFFRKRGDPTTERSSTLPIINIQSLGGKLDIRGTKLGHSLSYRTLIVIWYHRENKYTRICYC